MTRLLVQNPCKFQFVGIHFAQEDARIQIVAEVSGDSQTTHHSFGDFVILNMLVNTLDLLEIVQVPTITCQQDWGGGLLFLGGTMGPAGAGAGLRTMDSGALRLASI